MRRLDRGQVLRERAAGDHRRAQGGEPRHPGAFRFIADGGGDPVGAVRQRIDTFGKLQRKEIKPFMAVASGKIKVKGDMSIAAKLKKLT